MITKAVSVAGLSLQAALVLAAAFAAPTAHAQYRLLNYWDALAAPDIGGARIRLAGRATSSCVPRVHSARREPGNVLVIEMATAPPYGVGCQFVFTPWIRLVPFANLAEGQYEVVVLEAPSYPAPGGPVEFVRFPFGVPIATGVPVGNYGGWLLLVLVVFVVAARKRFGARVSMGRNRGPGTLSGG